MQKSYIRLFQVAECLFDPIRNTINIAGKVFTTENVFQTK